MTSSALTSGPSPVPSPISWPPSQQWDGDYGKWSSFALRVGTPGQIVRVLISTASEATWVILPGGCPPDTPGISPSLTCSQSRGELFDPSTSQNWTSLGNYSLGAEVNLGYDFPGEYGLDTVALGSSNYTDGPTLSSQIVAGLETFDYYTGMFGLSDQPVNLKASPDSENLTDRTSHPSFLATLKAKNLIPSLSWAYTAGAPYRFNGVFGSLTFGGSDLSRYFSNNVVFDLAPDVSRQTVVSLKSISLTDATRVAVPLLSSAITIFIDSTFPYLYLPLEACEAFEAELGLIWNATEECYFVDDSLHESLIANNPTFNFSIGNNMTGGPTVDIVLPYASFDFDNASYPMVLNSTRFFPLQRSANETQYTLGRQFLQEAYLVTNYELSKFSLYQAKFEEGLPAQIVAISSTNAKTESRRGEIVGASVGTATCLLVMIFIIIFAIRKGRGKLSKKNKSSIIRATELFNDLKTSKKPHELDNNSLYWGFQELLDTGKAELLDQNWPSGSGNKIQEMPTLAPVVYELMTDRNSPGSSVIQNPNSRKRSAVFLATGVSREACTSFDASGDHPRINTVVTSSPRRNPSRRKLLNPDRPLSSPLQCQSLDLNRSLPTTPISESPQVSPGVTNPSSAFTIRDYLHNLSNRTSVAHSTYGDIQNVPRTLITKPAEVYDRYERSYLSDPSMEMEIVIPPGSSGPPSSSVTSDRFGGERRGLGHSF